jgi:CarD family transcriptional regulator
MFEIGTYVIYGNTGICKIEDITTLDMPGANNDRLYYVLSSLQGKSNRDFIPVDNTKVVIRSVIDEKTANELLERFDEIPEIVAENDKLREEKFKEFTKRSDCECWIAIIKTISARKKERIAQGKKITATDERYYRLATEQLYNELAFSLEMEIGEVEEMINTKIKI